MDGKVEQFLKFLVYFYLKYHRFDQAYILSKYLTEICPDDCWSHLLLATANYYRGQPYLSLPELEKFQHKLYTQQEKKIYFLLKSKILWSLGDDLSAHAFFDQFLQLKQQDVRMHALAHLSTGGVR